MGPEAKLVKPRFARGCRCFAVVLDGSIAGYAWLSTGPEWIGELQLEIKPRKAEGYIWNCATLSEHRHKGIFRSLLVGVCEASRNTGLRRLWIGSVAIPAEKAVGPSGFRPALRFWTWRLGSAHVLAAMASPRGDLQLISEARSVLGSRDAPFALGMAIRRREDKVH
jgi:GNAT superfamily N-acetyltransferase